MIVTIKIFRNIPIVSISMMAPAVNSISNGVMTGANNVEAQVMPTEKATSP